MLGALYYCFTVRPWFRNVPKSLRRQPKVYLWDWSAVADPGARHENFVASHLLKATHLWTDTGLGEYGLHYLRDKAKREVDFVVTRMDFVERDCFSEARPVRVPASTLLSQLV